MKLTELLAETRKHLGNQLLISGCSRGILVARHNLDINLWAGINGSQGVVTPSIGLVVPKVTALANQNRLDAPFSKIAPKCGPPIFSVPLYWWQREVFAESQIASKKYTSCFWDSDTEGQFLAKALAEDISTAWQEASKIFPGIEALISWATQQSRLLGNEQEYLIPAYYVMADLSTEFVEYTEKTIRKYKMSPGKDTAHILSLYLSYLSRLVANSGLDWRARV